MASRPATLSHPDHRSGAPPATFLPPSHGAGATRPRDPDPPINNDSDHVHGGIVPAALALLFALFGIALESSRSRAQSRKKPVGSWEGGSDVNSSTSYSSDGSSSNRDAITVDFPSPHGELRRLEGISQAYFYSPANTNHPNLQHRAFTDRDYRGYVDKHIKRLENDLNAFFNGRRVTSPRFKVELRLAGRVKGPNQPWIELKPTIVISCAKREHQSSIKKALKDSALEWATTFRTWVRVGGISLNSARTSIQVPGLDLPSGGGIPFRKFVRVHLHLQVPDDGVSACGLLLCATITYKGVVVDQQLSRLGGLLKVDSRATWATSTAHGIVDALSRYTGVEPETSSRSRLRESGAEHPPDIRDGEEEDEIGEGPSDDTFNPYHQRLLGQVDPRQITRWRQISDIRALDFIQPAITTAPGANTKLPHDFALFSVTDELQNSYEEDGSRHLIHGYLKDKDLPTANEDVKVLLGSGSNPWGRIQPGSSSIFLSGVEFKTKKILLPGPLGMRTSRSGPFIP